MPGLGTAVALAVGLCTLASPASAEIIAKDYFINASGNCNGALPTYEGALRKRPLAIRNEGATNAFVSCSIPRSQADDGYTIVGAYFSNSSGSDKTINCTLVDGAGGFGAAALYPKSLMLAAGTTDFIAWSSAEFELTEFASWINLSCNLPAGTEIGLIGGYFGFENGVPVP
jgi:hypothetical protein